MADREKILRYFKAGGDEQLAAKLLDLAEGANKSRKFRVSEFLDPHAYNVAEIIAANYENVRLESDGGFSNAERVKAAFVADDFYGQPDFGMAYFWRPGISAIMICRTAIFWVRLWARAASARPWAISFLCQRERSSW